MKFLLALLLFISTCSFAQKYNFSHFSEAELKSDFFYEMDQNSKGLLYIASSKGLIIYDGIKFQILNEKDSLLDEFVSKVYVDQKDQVWISYYKGGLSKLTNNKISTVCEDCSVKDIFELPNENILITTDEIAYEIENKSLKRNERFFDIEQIEYFSDESTINLSKNKEVFYSNEGENPVLLLDSANFISTSKDGSVLAIINDKTFFIYTHKKNGTPKLDLEVTLDDFNLGSDITCILTKEKKVILGTEDNGLFEIFLNPGYQSYSIQHFSNKNGLGIEKINCLFSDREENLWIGSYGDGISVLPKKRISKHAENSESKKNKINTIEYHLGELYVGSENGMRLVNGGKESNFKVLEGRRVIDLESAGDTLWIGTSMGLYYLSNNNIRKFEFESLRTKPMTINKIQIYEQKIYLGTNNGFFIHDLVKSEEMLITTGDGLAHNVIEDFIIDTSRRFWFDSPNSPIYSYQDGEFEYHKNVTGFNSFNLTAIMQSEDGEIWFGTEGDGIFRYSEGEFNQITQKDGLFSDYIYFLEETADHKIIAGNKSSVSLIKPQVNSSACEITDIGKIPELEYIIANSFYLSASDYLWVGTSFGIARIPKISKFENKYLPKLTINSINVNSKIYSSEDPIELPYGNYYLEVEFGAIYLTNATSVQFQYILEGFDKEWSTVTFDKTLARYQSIQDGEYTFRIKLIFNGQEQNLEESFTISIERPYWKKTSFYVLMGFIIIVLFILSVWLTNRRNRKIRLNLVAEVKARTTDLVKKNSEITIINSELETLSEQYLEAKNRAEYESGQIAESITYAKNIQKALFRRNEYREWIEVFADFFLVFKPKDLVSGDFYWGAKNDKYAYVGVGDCTGHGVPGAMISMLGASFLNDAIAIHSDTNKLLDTLRSKVIEGLNQNADSQLSDGMDICLLRVNTETLEAQFAGAMNPIFIIRPISKGIIEGVNLAYSNESLNLFSTSPDKQPIGYYSSMTDFNNTEFQLKKGDKVYLFTDGYSDQFGGPRYKKFMRKNLWDLLLEIHDLPMEEQKNILWETMVKWMGDQEQIDDISVIGLTI